MVYAKSSAENILLGLVECRPILKKLLDER